MFYSTAICIESNGAVIRNISLCVAFLTVFICIDSEDSWIVKLYLQVFY